MTNYLETGYTIKNNDTEEIISIPYNINNKLATTQDIINILAKNKVKVDKIHNIELFHDAFTHKSYCKKNCLIPDDILKLAKKEFDDSYDVLELRDNSYERLEYLGDRVIKISISKYLFNRFPHEDEGFMTRLQIKIEDKTNLAIMSKEIGLQKFFIISKHTELLNGRNLEKINEDCFEAFCGALFESNGFEVCLQLITNLLESLIDYSEKLYRDNNYKDTLLRYHHKNKFKHPKYEVIHFEGPPNKRIFIVGVINPNIDEDVPKREKYISFGLGKNKKMAEQAAAKMSLINHGMLNDDQFDITDIYHPDWDAIENFDGENYIILENKKDTETKSVLSIKSRTVSITSVVSDKDSVVSNLSEITAD